MMESDLEFKQNKRFPYQVDFGQCFMIATE